MEFTPEHKEEMERRIVNTIITALEKGNVQESVLPEIAREVLSRIDQIQNEDQFAEFLTEMSAKWPIFQGMLEIELGKIKSQQEKQIAHDVLQLAHSGNIEEAIRLAKTMTEQQ